MVTHVKCFFAIDYQEFEEEGCVKDMNLHHLRQRRKTISNNMRNKHGLTLTKSTKTRKVAEKNWSVKRKLGVFKKEFTKCRDRNTSKVKYN